MNKKILIDCGSNYGQGFTELSKKLLIDDTWKVIMYEPNKDCYNFLIKKYKEFIDINNCGVWNKNAIMTFNIPDPRTNNNTQGSTFLGQEIFSNHISNGYGYVDQYEVNTIDLATVIESYKNYEIYLKLDIEGAEYDVLEHLIKLDLIKPIEKIFVEFHNRFVKPELQNEYNSRYNSIIQYFSDNNIKWSNW